jgi:hypothetical protein
LLFFFNSRSVLEIDRHVVLAFAVEFCLHKQLFILLFVGFVLFSQSFGVGLVNS